MTTSGSSAVPPEATRTEGLDELAHVGDAVLQQVADPRRTVGQQLGGVPSLDVLGEQQDPEALVQPTKLDGGPQALVGEGGRHADVDDGHVGAVALDRRRRASGSLTASVTTKPRSTSSWTRPSRRMAESSAMTTRIGSVI